MVVKSVSSVPHIAVGATIIPAIAPAPAPISTPFHKESCGVEMVATD
jgi:hypothetical protein